MSYFNYDFTIMLLKIYFMFFTSLVFLWLPVRKFSEGLEFPGPKRKIRIFAMFQQFPATGYKKSWFHMDSNSFKIDL